MRHDLEIIVNAKTYCTVSGTIFIVIALVHIWRFVADWPVNVGGFSVGRNVSIAAVILGLALGAWAFKSAGRIPPSV